MLKNFFTDFFYQPTGLSLIFSPNFFTFSPAWLAGKKLVKKREKCMKRCASTQCFFSLLAPRQQIFKEIPPSRFVQLTKSVGRRGYISNSSLTSLHFCREPQSLYKSAGWNFFKNLLSSFICTR